MEVEKPEKGKNFLVSSAILVAVFWTVAISTSLIWNVIDERTQMEELSKNAARSYFNKDKAFRFWAAKHGGVYVPVNERTQPNPQLSHVSERDITTPSGKPLTLMNPAYMLRQAMDEFKELYGVQGIITSLKVLNPNNAPDEWEKKALLSFENGAKEFSEFIDFNGKPHLRLMRPMVTKEICLKCHAYQGYKVGDIRGGVGVSVPMDEYLSLETEHVTRIALSHIFFLFAGWGAIFFVYKRNKQHLEERLTKERELDKYREDLEESEEKFRSLTTSANDAILSADSGGNIVFWNNGASKIFGYSEEDAQEMNITDLMPQEFRDAHKKGVVHFLSTGKPKVMGKTLELTGLHKNGFVFPIELSLSSWQSEKGTFFAGIIRDVTERKETEVALQESEEKYRTLIQKIKTAVVVHSADTQILTCNLMAQELLGLTEDQMLGKTAMDPAWHFFQEDGTTVPLENYPVNRVISTGKPIKDYVIGVYRPVLQDRIWVLVNADPVMNENGEISQVIVTFVNITELKDAEAALKESEAKFIDLYDNAPDMYASVDAKTTSIKQCNQTLASELGFTKEEIVGKPIFDIYHPDCMAKVQEAFHAFVTTGKVSDVELQLKRKDNSKLEVSLNVSSVRDKNGNILHSRSVWRDNTERKQILKKLKELNTNLEILVAEEVEKSRQKDQVMLKQSRHIEMAELLVNIAHQWRQPICSIGVIAQDVEDAFQCKELDELYLHDSVARIMVEVKELSNTIKQFSTFFAKEPKVVVFEVEPVIRKSLLMLENLLKRKNIAVDVNLIDEYQCAGYPNEFAQAVYNIINNSIEICEDRNVKNGKISIRIEKNNQNKKTRIEIADNCGGINENILDKVFDPYFTSREKTRGKGVGLFMSKTIIESNMRGKLWVENTQNGANFILEV